MNDVTEDVPACAGSPTIAAVAPGITRAIAARYTPEAERALAELEDALDLHGAPDPERTAAWLESEAEPAGAILAVVPRG